MADSSSEDIKSRHGTSSTISPNPSKAHLSSQSTSSNPNYSPTDFIKSKVPSDCMMRMLSSTVVSELAVLALVYSCAATTPRIIAMSMDNLFRRGDDACPNINPVGGSTSQHDYFNGAPDGCPFKNMMNDKGSCQDALKNVDESHCSAYCEVKNTWFHGQEVPIKEFSSCRANSPCEYTTTDTITVTQSFAFNVNAGLAKRSHDADDETGNVTTLGKRGEEGVLKPSFNLGATYTYSESKATAKGLTLHRPTNTVDQCGYWTFVPIFWTSCGTMTTAEYNHNWYGNTEPFCVADEAKDTGNYCNTSPYLDGDGNQAGVTVFVLIDCNTNKLLPKEKQDPIYQQDGVATTPFP